MDKKEMKERNITPSTIVEMGGQVFYNNCSDKEFCKRIIKIGSEDPKFAAMLFNVVQKIYCQGMQHGAAMTAYGSNNNEIRNKILKVTEYNEEVFDVFWEMAKDYLKVV